MAVYHRIQLWGESFIPPAAYQDPDGLRRCRLIVAFALLGIVFSSVYALFYFLIGHFWGGILIGGCTFSIGLTPLILRRPKPALVAGNFFSMILATALIGLSFMEGGIHGHSIAWLCIVPLISLLLAGRNSALLWCGLAVMIAWVFAFLDYARIQFTPHYSPELQTLITLTGYSGLIIFAVILMLILERNRQDSYEQLQIALHRFAEANERLIHLNKEKNEILGIAAHDLKNPLTAVMGSTELIQLANHPANPKIEKSASLANNACKRMLEIINDLLDVNHFEEAALDLRREKVDLNQLLMDLLPSHQVHAAAKNIQLHVVVPATAEAFVEGDRRALFQVADNLISNALKYSPPHRQVHVRLDLQGTKVLLEVEDEGPGIPEKDRSRLFHKFAQLSARPTAGESSHGLGLSIAKKYTEAMGGMIICAPFTGSGARFIVEFPKPVFA